MIGGLLQAAGGLGLFVLGMSVMTGGLRTMADDRLRGLLRRSTKSPVSGVCTGALTTALIQSSSATTVAAVGFVHAGLMTFSQALGIIFGANIGTTITGWLVALVGFKLQLGEVVLPLIFLGMLLRLAGRGRVEATGTSLAGFGLIFVGIGVLQNGMSAFEGVVTPESFPADTLGGRLLLLLIGVAITLVTQSSSAGVATSLTAIHAGAITLPQAAAMVIGMDVGTTVTAALASIGGNVQARRTALAHILYNVMVAVVAFLLLTPFLSVADIVLPALRHSDPELLLVGFHTSFNVVGVALILPFTTQFAHLIIRLFPERGNPLTRRLDPSLLAFPDVALQAVGATLDAVVKCVSSELVRRIDEPDSKPNPQLLADVKQALDQTRLYLQELRIDRRHPDWLNQYLRSVHILDHLRRTAVRAGHESRLQCVRDDAELSAMTDELLSVSEILLGAACPMTPEEAAKIHDVNTRLKRKMRAYRRLTMRRTAIGKLDTRTALQRMDTARWLRRIIHHFMRIAHHSTSDADETPQD